VYLSELRKAVIGTNAAAGHNQPDADVLHNEPGGGLEAHHPTEAYHALMF
jgi:hypothetical protein